MAALQAFTASSLLGKSGDFYFVNEGRKQVLGVDDDNGEDRKSVRCDWDKDNNSATDKKYGFRVCICGVGKASDGLAYVHVTIKSLRTNKYLHRKDANGKLCGLFADFSTPTDDNADSGMWELVKHGGDIPMFAVRSWTGHYYLAAPPKDNKSELGGCHKSIKCETNDTPDHPSQWWSLEEFSAGAGSTAGGISPGDIMNVADIIAAIIGILAL